MGLRFRIEVRVGIRVRISFTLGIDRGQKRHYARSSHCLLDRVKVRVGVKVGRWG